MSRVSGTRAHDGLIRRVAQVCVFLLALASPVLAQQSTGAVRGTVMDEETGRPAQGAYVRVAETGLSALTDASGSFLLSGIAPGAQVLLVERLGSKPSRTNVTIEAGRTLQITVTLQAEALALPSMVITATREAQRLTETAATVGYVSGGELRRQRPTHPSSVMGQIPGVWVSTTGGEGHMTSIRMPQTTNPVYLFLEDGVPTRSTGFFNHNALYEVNVPQADRVEVLKGPATALYGSDAIGGIVNVETRPASEGMEAEAYLEGGAFGWQRFLGSLSMSGVRADVNVSHTDGWRSGTAYDRQSVNLRWDTHVAGGSLKTTAAWSHIDQNTAGSSALARTDYENDPTRNYTPISFREVTAVRLSSMWERAGENGSFSITPYARWNDMELLPNWALSYDPTVYTTGHASFGVLAKVRRDLPALRARVIGGVDLDYSPGKRLEQRVAPVREGQVWNSYTLADTLYDYDATYHAISPYVQVEARLLERLSISAGLRYDRAGFDYTSRLAELQSGRHRRPADAKPSYDNLSPKLGFSWDAATLLNLYGSYSEGFRSPSEGQLFRQGQAVSTIDLDPVIAKSKELGVRGQIGGRFTYQVAAYRMDIENDIVNFTNVDGSRETLNAGATRHQGIEAGIALQLPAGLRTDVAYTRAQHEYVEWSPRPDLDYAGKGIEAAPRSILNLRASWSPEWIAGSRITAEWTRIGKYWMDAENTHRYDGHALLNLRVNAPITSSLEVIGRLDNITNERYAETAAYTIARGEELAPGLPRALYLGVQYRWNR